MSGLPARVIATCNSQTGGQDNWNLPADRAAPGNVKVGSRAAWPRSPLPDCKAGDPAAAAPRPYSAVQAFILVLANYWTASAG